MIKTIINLIQNKIKFMRNKCNGCECGGCEKEKKQIRNKYGFPTYQSKSSQLNNK
jgi:hypothetical protein